MSKSGHHYHNLMGNNVSLVPSYVFVRLHDGYVANRNRSTLAGNIL